MISGDRAQQSLHEMNQRWSLSTVERSKSEANVICGSGGAVPGNIFRIKLIGLLENALFIIT